MVLPSYWFASLWSVVYNLKGTSSEIVAAACGIIIPFISLWMVVRFLAPSFNQKLSLISNSGSNQPVSISSTSQKIKQEKKNFSEMIAPLFTRRGAERTGFLFAWKMMARSRDFKMKVYPSIGYFIVYAFIVFFNSKNLHISDIKIKRMQAELLLFQRCILPALLHQWHLHK